MNDLRPGAVLVAVLLSIGMLPAVSASPEPGSLQKVRLQLKWTHQFQFAGYYVAQTRGFYRDEGLEVELIEGGPAASPIAALVRGDADYAISDADALIQRLAGAPVVLVASVFQHTPLVVISRAEAGIRRPSDLVGRRIAEGDNLGRAQVRAMLRREGLDSTAVRYEPRFVTPQDLLAGRVDAITGYATNEAFRLMRTGVDIHQLRPADYGVDFVSDSIFTTEDELREHPERVAAFRRASLRGWQHALAHVDETIGLVLRLPGVRAGGHDAASLRFEAQEIERMIEPGLVELGHVNTGRWERMAETIADIGLAPRQPSLAGFFLPEPRDDAARPWPRIVLFAAIAAPLLLVVAAGATIQLRRVIQRHTAELRREAEERLRLEAKVQHAQKLESLGVMAGGIAHDFNNLLAGVLGHADVALQQLPMDHPAYGTVQKIETTAERAADLTRQLLAYSGRARREVRPLSLPETVGEITHLLRVSISKKCALELRFAQELPPIEADPNQVRQVVMNLIINASEAIGDAPGTISVETGLAHCDAETLRRSLAGERLKAGDYVYLEVRDTGCGMNAETLARVFEPFFTTKLAGRGLGLAAVLGIVRGHNGAVQIDTQPGRGTTFRVLFPAAPNAVPLVLRPVAPQPVDLEQLDLAGTGTVLVVDDEETVRELASLTLAESGFDVLQAEDGRAALDVFEQQQARIRLVVLDMTMPRMDGLETFRELRRLDPSVRVLLSSGYTLTEGLLGPDAAFLAGFVAKPYRRRELLLAVREALDKPLAGGALDPAPG